jgi:RNA polymerase-binding transcription factor DksA
MTDVRTRLTARLDSLLTREGSLQARLRAPLEADSEEQAAHLEQDDALTQLSDAVRADILALRAALGRLDAGTYGQCTRCGQPIPPRRLDALPGATTCVSCG